MKTKLLLWPQRVINGELLEDTKTTTVVKIESIQSQHKNDWKAGDIIRFNKQLIIKQENENNEANSRPSRAKIITPKI